MNTKEFQYHLTFNGNFSNETYIEYFDPENFDKYKAANIASRPIQSECIDALKTLKYALNEGEITDDNCEKTFRKIREVLAKEQCNSDCNPSPKPSCNSCGNQKESVNLYFLEEYEKATDIIKDIIKEWPCDTKPMDLCDRIKCQWDNLPKNNRILFHGQRGSGKTSVTMSVARSLEGHSLCGCKFKVLPIINPGYFDDDTNILKTIISNMFEMAKCIIKKENNDSQRNEHEELLKQFEEVYRLLGCIESPNKDKHTLETLNEISKASGMRESLQKLINQLIRILPCKAKYLVLVIDDVDMSVAYAATMLEQINKFLELDNLLILISANLGQLHNEMREHYSKAFEKTLRDKNQALSIDVEDLASKYLLKLFPTSRRINVERPVSQLLQTELIINDEKRDDLQKIVLSLIWEKTRLLYIPKDVTNTLHPIIPTNLRELAQLINLLQGMEKVEIGNDKNKQLLFADKKSYENCQKNINTFKNYFFDIWVPTHLSVDEEQVFKNIPSDITEINKHLINSINVIGTRNKKRLMSREVDLDVIERNAEGVFIDRDIYTMVSPNDPRFVKANKISDIFNQPSNYSYGDLLLMIDKYETYFESEEDRRFSNAIRIYYSILLFETMFFKSNNVKFNKAEFDAAKSLGEEVIPIQKLIGGTVYYPNYFEIITSKYFTQKGPSFDAKRAFYHKLIANEKESIGKRYPVFSLLYYGDIRPDRYETTHIYDTTYNSNADVNGTKYVTFDILSILSNMLNPWHTLYRTDKLVEQTKWNVDISNWEECCTCADNSYTTPNSILPFYSVDTMLLILKKQFRDVDIMKNDWFYQTLEEDKRIIEGVRDILFDRNNCFKLISKNEVEVVVDYSHSRIPSDVGYSYKLVANIKNKTVDHLGLYKDPCEIRVVVNRNDGASYEIIVDDSPSPIIKPLQNSQSILKFMNTTIHSMGAVIKNIQKILIPLMECYSTLTDRCDDTGRNVISEKMFFSDRFKDHCIAIILSNYKGGEKEKNALIKGLKKFNTISEVYKYLVDQLWEDPATEILIRQQIQKGIRHEKRVFCYYENLMFILTKSHFVSDTQSEVYNGIFDKARRLFITDSNNTPL